MVPQIRPETPMIRVHMTYDPERRAVLKAVGGAGAFLAAGGVGAVSARNGRREGASAGQTIFDIAEESEDFTILELALEETGLDAVLDAEGRQYTVFAPTDAAFEALLADLGITAGELLANPDLASILLYHVTSGRRYASSVVNAPQLRMLNGDTVAVDGTDLNDGQATIVGTDIEASNGVIHVLDGVLLS
jgi:uncharacterized surface protein with fasciclin (FAS1) repeats